MLGAPVLRQPVYQMAFWQTGSKPPPAPPFQLGYRRALDGLRGIAVLLVLANHFHLLAGGFFGVDVFFVLSGFLITTLLVEEWERHGSIHLGHFYLRRALRLLPAFFAVLLLCLLSNLLFRSRAETSAFCAEMALAVCYISNWQVVLGVPMPHLGHTWSLSVEEQFYLLWPLLLYGMLRAGLAPRHIIPLVVVGIGGSATLRAVLYELRPGPGVQQARAVLRLYMALETRADALLIGCLVGLLVTWSLLPQARWFHTTLRIGAFLSVIALTYALCTTGIAQRRCYCGLFTLVALMTAVIIVYCLKCPSPFIARVLESELLVRTGRISYGLYLFHVPIIRWLGEPRLGWSYPGNTMLVFCLSLIAALLSYHLIERPCLRWKVRLDEPTS